MKRLSGLALLALAAPAFVLVGCGGNSGTQITSVTRGLSIQDGTTYPGAAPVATVNGAPVAPLASFTTAKDQRVVVWGSRDAEGRLTGIDEMAYAAPGVAPLYAKYDANGGLATVLDSDTGSYVTFGPLDGSSIECTGYDATRDRTATVRATLSDVGVTVEVVTRGRGPSERRFVPNAELAAVAHARVPADDPLAGLDAAFGDSDARTRIIDALIHAAGFVVKAPFDGILRDVAGFMLPDRFTESYGRFTAKGTYPTAAAAGAPTPLAYRADLP